MFGYDWQVDKNGVSQATAVPLSDHEIEEKLLTRCAYAYCLTSEDALSSETKVTYDNNGERHIVWFEDAASAARKEQALSKYHIQSFGFWAYSYF